MSDLSVLAWEVLEAARAWRAAREYGPYDYETKATGEALRDAVDALNAALAPAEDGEPVPWMDVLAGDLVLMKTGEWVPVTLRTTRRNGVSVTVAMPGAAPGDEPRPHTFLMPFTREVRARRGEDAAAVELLKRELGAMVIESRETA